MRTIGTIGLALLGCLGAVLMAGPPSSLAEREVVVRNINNWNATCAGSTRCWSTMTSQWYNEITNDVFFPFGHSVQAWYRDGNYVDGNIVDSDFTDSDKVSWGRDNWNDRPDEVDAAMIALHGSRASGNGRWVGRVRVNEAGNGNCNSWQGHMDFGDWDNEFLHISSCNSMQKAEWHPHWSQSFKGVHQINAFHGIMWIFCNGYPSRYRDFADDSFYIPIALAWLDNMYDRRSGANNDQCPVSRGVGVGGSGQANCWARMYNERYNNVLSDPTSPTWHGVIYYTPCDPNVGSPL